MNITVPIWYCNHWTELKKAFIIAVKKFHTTCHSHMQNHLTHLHSENLLLCACTEEITCLAIQDKKKLSEHLDVRIDELWPVSPEAYPFFLDMIKSNRDNLSWLNYIVILEKESAAIGDVGFLGPPNLDGIIEIGYSVIPVYRGRGYATEMVAYIIKWAFSNKDVKKIIAHTTNDNDASIRILKSNDFRFIRDIESDEGLKCLWEKNNPICGMTHKIIQHLNSCSIIG